MVKQAKDFAVVARTERLGHLFVDELHKDGFDVVKKDPDVVLCVGGEGATLWGEIYLPGKPRLCIIHREERLSAAQRAKLKKILAAVKNKKFKLVELPKLQAVVHGRALGGINDINVHYSPPYAIGLEVRTDKRTVRFLGDGIVVATPYGSPAYFHSITGRTFSRGIGIAFNNPSKPIGPLFLDKNAKITVKVWKHRGVVAADSNPHLLDIKTGDTIKISVARETARAIHIKGFPLKIKL